MGPVTDDPAAAPSQDAPRPLRADARRNRDKLLAAARAALETEGGAFSLDAVARGAGVGIGTLYRHFPTREALMEAVYGAELDALAADSATLLAQLPPEAALREWAARYSRFTATKRGMSGALRQGLADGRIPATSSRERITAAIAPILAAGAADGSLRADVAPDDVTTLLLGTFLATAASPEAGSSARLLDLVVDALRPQPSGGQGGRS
jgi:AcrR family transcriptional regulator